MAAAGMGSSVIIRAKRLSRAFKHEFANQIGELNS